jgi:hypothetical protein
MRPSRNLSRSSETGGSTFPKSTPFQDVFLYLRDQEQKVKEAFREPVSRDAAEG